MARNTLRMYADIFFRRELDLFSSDSRGTRDFSAAFSGFPSRALGFFDPYFIILLRGGGKGIRLQILLRLDCQLAEKIRFIGIVGNLDDPCFPRILDSLIESSAVFLSKMKEHSRLFETLTSDRRIKKSVSKTDLL